MNKLRKTVEPFQEWFSYDMRAFGSRAAAILVGLILLLANTSANAAGLRQITTQNVTFGVWYPSDAAVTYQRLGPFDVQVARDASIRDGKHDLLLLSHGRGGRFRNHYLTAQHLADAGYVVIAPQHQADYLVGGSKTAKALQHRYLELNAVLEHIKTSPHFSDHINTEIVHGLGYSLGGATVMLAAGAGYDPNRSKQYCRKNSRTDAAFCDEPRLFRRLIQSLRHRVDLPDVSGPFRNSPLITGKVILVAPVFQGLDLQPRLSMTDLTVIAIEGDTIAKPEFHAKPLFDTASQQVTGRYVVVPGHHFAFIAPFPKWLTDEEEIPVAKDPEGFDRAAFLRGINAMILEYLAR